jgi:hypothetical protein
MFEQMIVTSYIITSIAYGIEMYNICKDGEKKYINVIWWAVNGVGSILALFYCLYNQPNDLMNHLMTLFMIQICLSALCLTTTLYFNFKDSFVFYNIKEIPMTPQIQNYLDTTTIYPETRNSNIIINNPLNNYKKNHFINNDENV